MTGTHFSLGFVSHKISPISSGEQGWPFPMIPKFLYSPSITAFFSHKPQCSTF